MVSQFKDLLTHACNFKNVSVSTGMLHKSITIATGEIKFPIDVYSIISTHGISREDLEKFIDFETNQSKVNLLPLCQPPYTTSSVDITITPDEDNSRIVIQASSATRKPGIEMEAVSAVQTAWLAIYELCKVLSDAVSIENIKLLTRN